MSEELQINGSVTVHTNGHKDDVQMVDTDSQTPGATPSPGISGDFSMASIDGSYQATAMSKEGEHSFLGCGYVLHRTCKPFLFTSVRCNGHADLACSFPAAPLSSLQPCCRFLPQFLLLQVLFLNQPLLPLPLHQRLASAVSQQESTVSVAQHRFCLSTIHSNLKKMKDVNAFLRPVNIVGLNGNIPHYPSIIKTPMDFSTIDRKLVVSHPTSIKPNLNEDTPRYYNADEFMPMFIQDC
jgi:bromodomain-containing factor 1